MKIGTPANYYVRVGSESWTDDAAEAARHAGTYEVDLNRLLTVSFVDDLTAYGPPWVAASLPSPDDDLVDPGLTRLVALFTGSYVVTPNEGLAGTAERFDRPWGDGEVREVVVVYVTRAEFTELRDDIEDLWEVAGGLHSGARRDDLLDRPVLRFIEGRVLPELSPSHAQLIGR